ncbi:SRPBCC family protein [Nevskia ramosa]|uniref:SRPBCC family protein n=1 Tax=Nevskia ramosa TaxID=64002 RepID=UPI0003B5033E|nr:SRPBCC family protein [Nevskia ramosa]
MKSIYAAAAVTLVSVLAAGCKPAPAPEAAPAEAAPAAAEAAPAAAGAELSVSKSVSIAAPADAVWAKVKDFNGMNTWHPAIAKSEIVEGTNNTVGAVRQLTLAGETPTTIKEKLTALDDAAKSFSYEIVEGPLPVSDYSSTLTVAADGAGSTVTWSSKFKAKGADDATATTTIEGVYTGGLDNLKKVLETK